MTTYLQDFLSASLNHLQILFPTFTRFYLSSSLSPPSSSEDEHVGLPHLVSPLIDFVSTATRGGKAKEWFDSGHLQALVGATFNYVQMTDEDVSNLLFTQCLEYRFQLFTCSRKILGPSMRTPSSPKKMTRLSHTVFELQDLIYLA
jgi:hypothetical protein